jgi:hypothetical protein
MQETITQYRRKLAYFIHCCKEDTGFEESKKLYSDGEASEASDTNTDKGGKGRGGGVGGRRYMWIPLFWLLTRSWRGYVVQHMS